MTLKSQSNLLALLAAATVAAVLAILFLSARAVREQTAEIKTAEQTAKAISQFRFLIVETALHREARSSRQWQMRVDSFRALLDGGRYSEAGQNILLDKEKANLAVLTTLYASLVSPDSLAMAGPDGNARSMERTGITVSALFLTTADMADDAFELIRLNRIDLDNSHATAVVAMIFSILALAGLIAAAWLVNRRHVLAPIALLQAGTEQVMNGDLRYRLDLRIRNELGVLGATFDRMTAQLDASYATVQTENAERRQAQAALETSHAKLAQQSQALTHAQAELQTIIDHMPAVVVYWDAQLHNRFANAAYLDWFGIAPARMHGQHIRDVIGTERFALLEPFLLEALAGKPTLFERNIEFADRPSRFALFSYVPDVVDGVVVGIYGFISDITQLKRAEAAQSAALAKLQGIVDAASDFSIIATDRDGLIELFSSGAERMLGYRADEMVQRQTPAILHDGPEVVARGIALSAQLARPVEGFQVFTALPLDGVSESREWTYVRKDGSTLPANLTVTAVRDEQHEIIGFLGIAKDIREEKALLSSLAAARDAAEAASLAKGQFLANMSHEIRTPMNAILGMLQLLQYTTLDPLQRDYAVKTESAAQSLLALLNDILDFSKVDANKMQLEAAPFELDRLLRDVSVILSANLGGKAVEVLFSIDPALPALLQGDVQRLRQVLLNLAGNAIKFSEQGEVIMAMRMVCGNRAFTTIEFAVSDTGIGIAADQLASIFDSFSQAEASTSRRFGGSGLGLAISARLVTLMGGQLVVSSEPGVGSRFSFTVRFANVAAAEPAPALPGKVLRALVIDDNRTARDVTLAMFAAIGWDGAAAASGAEALALLQTGALPFDVILVDWSMPDMDGWEVTRRIRQLEQGAHVPLVLMVTAHGRNALAERMQSERNALNGFLIKPVTAAMLREAVSDAAGGKALPQDRNAVLRQPSRLTGLRILVVDDNLLNQRVARDLLTRQGALVQVAGGGADGVAMALAASPPFDAVLMDIQMPEMDGYAATRALRQHLSSEQLPIIAMTANVMAADVAACRAAGMNDHIGKPISVNMLVTTLLRHVQPGAAAPGAAAPGQVPGMATDEPIEIDLALERLGGDGALFVSLAQQFSSEIDACTAELRDALQGARFERAADQLHTLKSTAGAIGAHRIAGFAAALEVQLRTDPAALSVASAMDELSRLVEQGLPALSTITARLAQSATPMQQSAASGMTLPALLDRLDALLAEANMDALKAFADIERDYHVALGERTTLLARHMAELDFKSALLASRDLRNGLI
ncbi:PAS domain S-box-containing protein [Actimicrobium sp. GrIS 1.19]|uniref:response regulator n=1 Tax=Actimicrobium sp. GrIS 1.19 TaxID=3071708 RepID=UPI002E03A011|nr:PAS domain S-box-containing protein [Actimicrobium sp. GrIS 1.19]